MLYSLSRIPQCSRAPIRRMSTAHVPPSSKNRSTLLWLAGFNPFNTQPQTPYLSFHPPAFPQNNTSCFLLQVLACPFWVLLMLQFLCEHSTRLTPSLHHCPLRCRKHLKSQPTLRNVLLAVTVCSARRPDTVANPKPKRSTTEQRRSLLHLDR